LKLRLQLTVIYFSGISDYDTLLINCSWQRYFINTVG